MSEKFYELFNNQINNEIKWISAKQIDNFIYKTSLIENALKHPLCEARDNKCYEELWKQNLNTDLINIDDFQNIMEKYDKRIKSIINNNEKQGYIIKSQKTAILYEDKQAVVLKQQDKNIFIHSSILKDSIFNLIPIFYTLKYNLYNLFFLGSESPIEYFDNNLNKIMNDTLKTTSSIKDAIFYFACQQNDESIEYQLIYNYYYANKNLGNDFLSKCIFDFENNISRIVKDRNDIYKEIQKLDNEIKIINDTNKGILKKIGELNNFIKESDSLRSLPESKSKQTKIDKFLKENTEIFIEYSKTDKHDSVENMVNNKINNLYETILKYPSDIKKKKESFINYLNDDIINTYKIAINYFLIMICISLSDETLESKYEGNLINKAIFDVKELTDLIAMINKNLLY